MVLSTVDWLSSEWVMVAIALIQLAATYFAYKVAGEAASAAKDSVTIGHLTVEQMQLERRAWLTCETPQIEPFEIGKSVRSTVSIKNDGNTPAVVNRQIAQVLVTDAGGDALAEMVKTVEREIEQSMAREDVVAPNAKVVFKGDHGLHLTKEQIDAISVGQCAVYILVRVKYCDMFGVRHITQGCYVYTPSVKQVWGYHEFNFMT